MISLRSYFRYLSLRKARTWTLLGAVVIIALLQVYYVQEMLAALILFSIVFVIVCAALLIIFLIDRASQRTVELAEAGATHAAHAARRGIAIAEELTHKHPPTADEPRQ